MRFDESICCEQPRLYKAPFHFKIVPLDCELLVDSHKSTIPSQAEALAGRQDDFHTLLTFKQTPPTKADLLSLCKQIYRFYRVSQKKVYFKMMMMISLILRVLDEKNND